jgi:hypothetical protein
LVPWRATEGPTVDRYCHVFDLEGLCSLLEGAGLIVEEALDEGANHVVHARSPG